ncbi:amidohydrolase [Prochlorococcus sp. MIT 1341]|uniref:amidohydrolase n=1 Tax=Prochlorococcus sp. MIT 1341 TaxID=3096221 RepID=UPI002A754CC0|nr:amidohydrolase [Prochlorococcus sp. MIT 1341]
MSNFSSSSFATELEKIQSELLEIRRHLHAHPELSGEEHQTAALVAGDLRSHGWEVREAVGRTGVLAEFGPDTGPLVGVRVDMDALPVEERTGLPYSSKRIGLMHACGHDLHTCIGIGIGRLLAQEASLSARVRLLFQPAEELAQGARWMKEDGAINNLEALFGVHVCPSLPVGTIGVKGGLLTAEAGELEIEVFGEGGHGARPHESIDAIWIAARVVAGLQEAISRRLDALNPIVISFGRIEGGKAFNVIADRVRLLGTVRCLDSSLTESLPIWIEEIVQGICSTFGATAVVRYRRIAPPVYNDPELTSILEKAAIEVLGQEKVLQLDRPSLGAEDFAELLVTVPGTMFRLGVAGKTGCAPLHNGNFCPEESSLFFGIRVIMATLLAWMKIN